jgi:hypothetical protein
MIGRRREERGRKRGSTPLPLSLISIHIYILMCRMYRKKYEYRLKPNA